jgi:hypothetical protein
MFCSKCGTDLPADSHFCRSCGQSLSVVSTPGGAAAAVAPARIPELETKSRNPIWAAIGVAVLLASLGMSWFVQQRTTAPAPQAQSPQPQLHTETTGEKAVTIKAGSIYSFKFAVPAGAYNVNLKGRFAATGGFGSDIETFLVTEDDLVNWENRHPVHALYSSGRVTQETLDVNLPVDTGTYYLVFSNKFSLISPKAMQTDLNLTYYTR